MSARAMSLTTGTSARALLVATSLLFAAGCWVEPRDDESDPDAGDCVPTTCETLGFACGWTTDGCGNDLQCGECGPDENCTENACIDRSCEPEKVAAFCDRLGATCGNVEARNNCGVTRNVVCGSCESGQTCAANACVDDSCEPEEGKVFCERLGATCGNVEAKNNCGVTQKVQCGACGTGLSCWDNACIDDACESDEAFCQRLNATCGNVEADNKCGVSRNVLCGACGAGQVCRKSQCVGEDEGCRTARDCGQPSEWICASNTCVAICTQNSHCPGDEICEDAVCRPPSCGSDDECAGDWRCVSGACEAPMEASSVASCRVLPADALLTSGTKKTFTVVSKDEAGTTLAYRGAVTFGVTEAARGSVTGGVVTGGAEAGAFQVFATIGAVDCTGAKVVNFSAAPSGKLRVIVADADGHGLVEGASVVVDGANGVATDENGVVEIEASGDAARTVSVFHDDFAWVTIVDTKSKDLLVYTRKARAPATFTGNMGARGFDGLADVHGTMHLALQGSSIATNLFEQTWSSFLGKAVETDIDLGSIKETLSLREGTVMGLGEQMWRGPEKNGQPGFSLVSSPGVRTLWSLGGNFQVGALIEALGPFLGDGGNDDGLSTRHVLLSVAPLLGRTLSGALTDVEAVAGEATSLAGSNGQSRLKLDTLLRLRVEATVPKLPSFTVASNRTSLLDAMVVGGAMRGSQGFVPLGFITGLDDDKDGFVDADELEGMGAGKLPLRMAPLHSGLEGSKYAIVALATSFEHPLGGDAEGPSSAISALVKYPGALTFNEGKPLPVDLGPAFLDVPSEASINADTRKLSAGSEVSGATFQRLSVGDPAQGEWHVYFEPGSDKTVTVPGAPAGKSDRLVRQGGETQPRTLLHSVRLGLGGGSPAFDSVVSFGDDNLDDLSNQLDAFSTVELSR